MTDSTSAPVAHVISFTAPSVDPVLVELARLYRNAEAAAVALLDSSTLSPGSADCTEYDERSDEAEAALERICHAPAESLLGVQIQTEAIRLLRGFACSDEQFERCSVAVEASTLRVLAKSTGHADILGR